MNLRSSIAAFRAAKSLVAQMAKVSPRALGVSAFLALVLTFTEGVSVLLLAPLLELIGVVEDPLPRSARWLSSALGAAGLETALGSVLALFVLVTGARTLVRRWQAQVVAGLREDLVAVYRDRLYHAVAAAEWRFLVTRTPSQFAHALTSEIGYIGIAVTNLSELAVAAMAAFVYIGLAIRLSPAMAGLVVLSAIGLGWFVHGTLARARQLGAQAQAAKQRLHAAAAAHVASIKTARSYGALEQHSHSFVELSRASRDVGLAVAGSDIELQQRLELGSTVLLAVIVYASATYFRVPPALLLVLLFVFARLMPRLINIYRLALALMTQWPVVEAVHALEAECIAAAEPKVTNTHPLPLNRGIRFERVSFSYATREDVAAVDQLDLHITAGQTTALVGPSGSGKSTVADLLMGLLPPTSGRILVDDETLSAANLSSWRQQIGYVAQDTFLFHDTVRANLRWARPGASERELWDALECGGAREFVAQLPGGLDTVIGEGGVLLAGGERQRLSIARALLRQPKILILDEATSSLDAANERRIQDAVDALHNRLTIVIIAHRLSTIRHADVIHVMEHGRVAQSGNWSELQIDTTGRFAAMIAGSSQS